MAHTTKSTTRPRAGRTSTGTSAGRFSRQSAGTSAGRFGRQSASTAPRRFGRPGTTMAKPRKGSLTKGYGGKKSPSRFSRGTKKSSKGKGLAGTLAGLLPTGAASKATPSSKKGKAGGMAALAAAAGVAFRNREKLAGMMGRGSKSEPAQQPITTPAPGTTVPRPGDASGSIPRPEAH